MADQLVLGAWLLAALIVFRILLWVLRQRSYYRKGLG